MGEEIGFLKKEDSLFSLKLVIALVVFTLFWFLLMDLDPKQRAVGAVFAGAVVLWVSEALPLAVTALLSSVFLVLLGASTPEIVFSSYGSPIIMLFLGGFILAKSMTVSGLERRIALMILQQRWATLTPSRVLLTIGVITCTFSLFVSNTAVTAMMLPIGLSILKTMNVYRRNENYANAMLLMLTWGSSVAVGTILATPPILIAIGLIEAETKVRIGFVDWMKIGMPLTVVMLLGCWLLLRLIYGRNAPASEQASNFAKKELSGLGKLKVSERNTLIAFFCALALWLAPGIISPILGSEHEFSKFLNERITAPIAALIGASLLFILPHKENEQGRTLSWKQAATIDWGTILLFGGGIALGKVLLDTGMAQTVGEALKNISGVDSVWAITAVSILIATIMSEFASNTASATTVVPIAIGLANSAGVSPIAPAIGAALGASFGFTLPISTPPNAIIYSSGLIPASQIMKAGIVLDIVGFFIIFFGLRLLLPLTGLM